jgi:hypothetical protein
MSQLPDGPAEEIVEDGPPHHRLADVHVVGSPGAPEGAQSAISLEEDNRPLDQLSEHQTRRVPLDPQVRHEALRWVLGMFSAVLVFGAVAALIGNSAWANTRDFLGVTFASVVGLVGTVLGFYFGRGGTGHQP